MSSAKPEVKAKNYLKFTDIFTHKEGISHTLNQMLDGNSQLALSQTSKFTQSLFYSDSETLANKMLLELGPNSQQLKMTEETAFHAYHRHKQILQSLIPVTSLEQLVERVAAYPNYHIQQLVTDSVFLSLLAGKYESLVALLLFDITALASVKKVIQHAFLGKFFAFFNSTYSDLITLKRYFGKHFPEEIENTLRLVVSKEHFSRFITDLYSLNVLAKDFGESFPNFISKVRQQVFAEQHFSRLIPDVSSLTAAERLFGKKLPGFTAKIRELALEEPHFLRLIFDFNSVIYLQYRFEASFPKFIEQVMRKLFTIKYFPHVIPNRGVLEQFVKNCPKYGREAEEFYSANMPKDDKPQKPDFATSLFTAMMQTQMHSASLPVYIDYEPQRLSLDTITLSPSYLPMFDLFASPTSIAKTDLKHHAKSREVPVPTTQENPEINPEQEGEIEQPNLGPF